MKKLTVEIFKNIFRNFLVDLCYNRSVKKGTGDVANPFVEWKLFFGILNWPICNEGIWPISFSFEKHMFYEQCVSNKCAVYLFVYVGVNVSSQVCLNI